MMSLRALLKFLSKGDSNSIATASSWAFSQEVDFLNAILKFLDEKVPASGT